MKTKYIWLMLLSAGFIACESDFTTTNTETPLPDLTTGTADFTNYVALGASFTAGYTDNGLFIAAQNNSFPNILSQQFAVAGGGTFKQPLMNDNIGGLLYGGNVIQSPRLFFNGAGPAVLPGMPTTEVTNVLTGPFNNVGVPGAKSFHLLANGYGNVGGVPIGLANPYFARMASSATASMLEDALVQSPTFFTLSEIGGNDVLGYATSGGTGINQLGNFDPTTYGSNDITDPNVFAQVFSGAVSALSASGAKGLVTNVPNITDLSHFTTVPHNPLDPSNPDFGPQIPTLNGIFGQLNQVYAFLMVPERSIVFSETAASAVVIKDESLANMSAQVTAVLNASPTFPFFVQSLGLPAAAAPLVANLLGLTYGQTRQATSNDLLVLPSSSIIGTVNADFFAFLTGLNIPPALAGQFSVEGITFPLDDKWVLLPSEQAEITAATNAYNATIDAVASNNPNVALVDLNSILTEASTTGIMFDNFNMNTSLVFGGLVSLDGIHLTARGYALMANEFLKVIDSEFGSNFFASGNRAYANNYGTIYSPTLQ